MEAPDIITVRVRGPYATALSKLLHEEGLRITQPSRVMQERMGLEDSPLPARATVKQADSPGIDLLIVGVPRAHDAVVSILKRRLPHSSFSTSMLEQYMTLVVEVVGEENGRCTAVHRGVKLFLETRACMQGKVTTAYIRRAPADPQETPVAREGFSILMDTLILFDSGPVSYSRHIYDQERLVLLENLSLKARQKGLGVRWRSNAARADPSILERELEEALARAEEFRSPLSAASLAPGEVLSRGNRITLSTLGLTDKLTLDGERRQVVPTLDYHHSLKTSGPRNEQVVAYSEYLLEKTRLDPGELGRLAWEYAWERLAEAPRVTLVHATPETRVLRLGPARVVGRTSRLGALVLERTVKTEGTYDGLGIEKNRGDVIRTIVMEGSWALAHIYYSPKGSLKGIYVNVNTPPEPGEGSLRYLDLHIDVTLIPDAAPRVVDREKLEASHASGRVGEPLYKRALETALEAERILSQPPALEGEAVVEWVEGLLEALRSPSPQTP